MENKYFFTRVINNDRTLETFICINGIERKEIVNITDSSIYKGNGIWNYFRTIYFFRIGGFKYDLFKYLSETRQNEILCRPLQLESDELRQKEIANPSKTNINGEGTNDENYKIVQFINNQNGAAMERIFFTRLNDEPIWDKLYVDTIKDLNGNSPSLLTHVMRDRYQTLSTFK